MSVIQEKYIYQIIILILLFSVGFVYAYDFQSTTVEYTSDVIIEDADYIRLIYIGSSGCNFSNNDKTHQMIKELKDYFRSFSHNQGYRFLSTGIALDTDSKRGVELLSKSGHYDEIISGANWLNLGAKYYIWDNFPGYPDTPQVILFLTDIKIRPAGISIGNIYQDNVLIKRIIGMNHIEELLLLTQKLSEEEMADALLKL